MPKTKISEFSATPGNNTDIDGINISEGCAPSGINDAIRELMAQLKDFQAGTAGDSFNGPIGTTTPAAGVFTNLSASGTFALTGDQVQISEGGTGQTTANAAFNALAPSQTSQAGKYLKTDGTNTSWDALDISTADITGTLPIANGGTGLTALGTGVQTALGIAVGSAGAFVVNGGALGTPSSGTVTNLTGTASININGTVGATTPTTGAFTTLSASGNITVSGGTANGVAYLNGSKVLTTGSALSFDGSNLGLTGVLSISQNSSGLAASFINSDVTFGYGVRIAAGGTSATRYALVVRNPAETQDYFKISTVTGEVGHSIFAPGAPGSSEIARFTSTGLGIGTSSPSYKLQVAGTVGVSGIITSTVTSGQVVKAESGGTGILYSNFTNTGGTFLYGIDNSTGSAIFSGSSNYAGFIGTSGATPLVFATNGTVRATLDSSGNLGLGVTPSAWVSNQWSVFEGAYGGALAFYKASNVPVTVLTSNAYNDGGWKYKTTDPALQYEMDGNVGIHKWYNAPSGTAGNAISFTQALTLNANGALVLQGGNTSASGVGVAFPATQSASSNANTLDDYEEGTWTVTLTCGTSGTITLDNSYNTGYYTKIGSRVFFNVLAIVSSVSSPVGLLNMNLPFATDITRSDNNQGTLYINANLLAVTATTSIVGVIPYGGSAVCYIRKFAAGSTSDMASDVQANSVFYVSGNYLLS